MDSNPIEIIRIFNEKFDEYIFQLFNERHPNGPKFSYENSGKDIPIIKFNIHELLLNIRKKRGFNNDLLMKIGYKLVDIKMTYSFLVSSMCFTHRMRVEF